MKRVFLITMMCLLLAGVAQAVDINSRSCADCTRNVPCQIGRPAGDGCNTAYEYVWCEEGQWYTDGITTITLLSCVPLYYKIDNPFNKGEEK